MLLAGGKQLCELCGLLQHEEKSDIYIQKTLNTEGGFSSMCVFVVCNIIRYNNFEEETQK